MATNKRKDAAALFELLDKSTLKVPKNSAGPLKIPGWWSRASRAAPVAPKDPQGVQTPERAKIDVRPPDAAPAGEYGPSDLTRFLPASNRWILPVAAGVFMLFMAVVVYLASRSHKAANSVVNNQPISGPIGGNQPPRLFNVPGSPRNNTSNHNHKNVANRSGTSATTGSGRAGQGHVVPINRVHRIAGHWYLLIVTTRPKLAQVAAQYIASHGVDVTLQPVGHGMDQIVSIEGFRKLSDPAARRLRRFVVHIGRELPQAKRSGRGAWDDAYFAREK